jgi:multidrug efflux pump subunit AcrB
MNVKVPTGSRIEVTEQYIAKVEDTIRKVVKPADFDMIVCNIGIVPDFSALYTSNSGSYTATVQVALQPSHKISSFDYMDRVRGQIAKDYPDLRTFVSSGSMVDSVLNMGMPSPIDLQVSGADLNQANQAATELADRIRELPGVSEAYIPQDMNYPAMRLNVDRVHAAELGLDPESIVHNVITALNSNTMIAPNYWVDRKSGNDYFLTVQYYENGRQAIHDFIDLKNIPLRAPNLKSPTTLDTVVNVQKLVTPTEVDHYQIQRMIDVYVSPAGEDLGKVTSRIEKLISATKLPTDVHVDIRGMVLAMRGPSRVLR